MGSDPNFLTLKLNGSRFNGGKIPLEVLADFAGLSELLIETAKWKFMQANPVRKRSPRGFTNGVELSLVEIKQGSAVPVIALDIPSLTDSLFPPQIADYMPQARDEVVKAIEAATSKRPINLPEHLLAHFDRFGRNLAESESIEFPDGQNGQPARLDKTTRRALLLASSSIDELTDVTQVRWLIPEADQARKSFQVELVDGRKVSGPLTAQHRLQLIEAFNGYTNRQRVLIDCIGRFNRNNRLIGIDSIEQVTLLDPLDISARLEELRSLRDGWLVVLKFDSVGSLALNVMDCTDNDLPVRPKPEEFPEHVVIDFTELSGNQVEKKAKKLRSVAEARGWQYRAL